MGDNANKDEDFLEKLGLSKEDVDLLEHKLKEREERRKEAEKKEKPITVLFPKVVLASASPRRQELIQLLGLKAEIHPSGIAEDVTEADPVFWCRSWPFRRRRTWRSSIRRTIL